MAPNGINLMLKSFGIDPEEIKKQLTETLNNATGVVKDEVQKLHTKIDNTQASLNRIEQMLESLMKHNGLVGISGGFDNDHIAKVGTQYEERMLPDGERNNS